MGNTEKQSSAGGGDGRAVEEKSPLLSTVEVRMVSYQLSSFDFSLFPGDQ